MAIERIYHVDQGYERLLEVFKDKPNIKAMIEIYFEQHDDLEKAILEVLNSRHFSEINTVIGAQLDVIGELVGQDRNGQSDADYRKSLQFRVGVNTSNSTPAYILNLLKTVTESTRVRYFPYYPAAYIMEFNGDSVPQNLLAEMQRSTAAGVNAGFIHNKDGEGWRCCEVGATQAAGINSILPEYTATSGTSASEIYIDNLY